MPADIEQLVRRVFHEGRSTPNSRQVLDELFSPDFACHGPPGMEHDHAGGAEGPEKCIFNNAFADLSFTVDGLRSEGDRVITTAVVPGVISKPGFGRMSS